MPLQKGTSHTQSLAELSSHEREGQSARRYTSPRPGGARLRKSAGEAVDRSRKGGTAGEGKASPSERTSEHWWSWTRWKDECRHIQFKDERRCRKGMGFPRKETVKGLAGFLWKPRGLAICQNLTSSGAGNRSNNHQLHQSPSA